MFRLTCLNRNFLCPIVRTDQSKKIKNLKFHIFGHFMNTLFECVTRYLVLRVSQLSKLRLSEFKSKEWPKLLLTHNLSSPVYTSTYNPHIILYPHMIKSPNHLTYEKNTLPGNTFLPMPHTNWHFIPISQFLFWLNSNVRNSNVCNSDD